MYDQMATHKEGTVTFKEKNFISLFPTKQERSRLWAQQLYAYEFVKQIVHELI